ncbi:MAG: HAD hydrolase-like protein [Muribaculaceae bacterium]|nr:HAD hydrolase-like protein [Muribaculaceae bacterium]
MNATDNLIRYVDGVKGLIFDYGGTLDTGGEHWSHVIRRAWQQAGVETDLATFREAYVYAERELARTLHILPHHDFHDLLRIKVNIELQWLADQGEFPPEDVGPKAEEIAAICNAEAKRHVEAAAPVLDALSPRFPLVLVSNFYGNIDTVLQAFGVRKYFHKVVESAVVGVRKPDPKIFSLGVEALGLQDASPHAALVVGDSYTKDVVPALEAGCRALWLKGPGWSDAEDAQPYPYVIQNLEILTKILR